MAVVAFKNMFTSTTSLHNDFVTVVLRACLHGGGGPQVGEVTRLGGVKN